MSNQINQREEDKKRLFGKTTDTQPEPIQEEEAGAAAADLEADLAYYDNIISPTKLLAFFSDDASAEQDDNYKEEIDFISYVKQEAKRYSEYKNLSFITRLLDSLIYMDVIQSITKQNQLGQFIKDYYDMTVSELKTEAETLLGKEKFADLEKQKEKYILSDPPTAPEIAARIYGMAMFWAVMISNMEKAPANKKAKLSTISFPVDKGNAELLKALYKSNQSGQLELAIPLDNKKIDNSEYNVMFSIEFNVIEDEAQITLSKKDVQAYHERIMLIAASYLENGQREISLYDIWKVLKNTSSKPSAMQLKRIDEALSLMRQTTVSWILQKPNGETQVKDASYLEFRRARTFYQGKLKDGKIILQNEPILVQLAKYLNNITTVDVSLLSESPLDTTEYNIRIERYFLNTIKRWQNAKKRGLAQRTEVTFKKVFEECNITDKSTKSRMKNDKIPRLLDFYANDKEFIKSYEIQGEKIIIKLS